MRTTRYDTWAFWTATDTKPALGTGMKFTKMHGSLNDYAVIDGRGLDYSWGDLARQACNRRTGIGADGILVVLSSTVADIRMGMFNPDGSEAEMCGNGIRCLAKYVLDRGVCGTENGLLTVETLSGIKTIQPTWYGDKVTQARVDMGYAELNPSKIPVDIADGTTPTLDYSLKIGEFDLNLAFVSMGNPHAVAFIDTPVEKILPSSLARLIVDKVFSEDI